MDQLPRPVQQSFSTSSVQVVVAGEVGTEAPLAELKGVGGYNIGTSVDIVLMYFEVHFGLTLKLMTCPGVAPSQYFCSDAAVKQYNFSVINLLFQLIVIHKLIQSVL